MVIYMFYTISKTETAMKELGYDFITNFNIVDELEPIYKEATERYGLDYRIINKAYDWAGDLLSDSKAFYVHEKHSDLSEFWKLFNEVRKEKNH